MINERCELGPPSESLKKSKNYIFRRGPNPELSFAGLWALLIPMKSYRSDVTSTHQQLQLDFDKSYHHHGISYQKRPLQS